MASDHGALSSNLVLSRSLLQRSGAPGRDKEIRHKIYSCFIERPARFVVDWTDFIGEHFRSIEGRWAVSTQVQFRVTEVLHRSFQGSVVYRVILEQMFKVKCLYILRAIIRH